jgi:Threonyl-tRNA synthetase
LGAELDLFSFPEEIGSGLAVFHPKGGVVRRVMEDYSRKRHEEGGYEFVNSPHITKSQLFEQSGHLDWYAEGMYPPMHLDAEYDADGNVRRQGADYYLKPMNCPMHNLIFSARGRSYRELPLRLFEFGTVYRYEKSGVVQGLTRARGFTQDDAHIYCTVEQMPGELDRLLTFVLDLLRDYGLDDFYLELSTLNPDKSVGTEAEWAETSQALH